MLGPVAARVQSHFAPVHAAARRDVLTALDSPRYFALLDSLDQLLAEPPLTPGAARPAAPVLTG
ncbi:MAG TPA: CHAD domain-containing protein, partial [Streptosporangiaceae bacterium]|nr:CHAD domain-containing protein [Streptosporangiaceae bacterium]